MSPERRVALREYRVMEAAQVVFAALLVFVVPAKFQHHQFADRVQKIARIERPAFGFTSRRCFLEERFISEKAHPLLHRQIFAVQPNPHDKSRQPHQSLRQLSGVGSADGLVRLVSERSGEGIRRQFARLLEARRHADESVEAGRVYTKAYAEFAHATEQLYEAAAVASEAPAAAHQH